MSMTERTYYVICEDNCRFESMTKEQIYDAIAEATGATPTPVDEAFITQIKEQNANHNIKVWKGTQAQYIALSSISADTLYFIDTNAIRSTSDLENAIAALQAEVQPVARGGTGATSAASARTNLGLSGARTYDLIWENASPSATFAAQTVALDLSAYDMIEVWYNFSASVSQACHTMTDVGTTGRFILTKAGDNQTGGRSYNTSTTGIEFQDAAYNGSTNNNYGIPAKIYGVKVV